MNWGIRVFAWINDGNHFALCMFVSTKIEKKQFTKDIP
jgi:hypothetical protein